MKIAPPSPDATQLLRTPEAAGIYQASDDAARALFQAGPAAGFNVYRIDLGQARDAKSLHHILARSLHFPDWYGANWDALADCLADMSWNEADGYLVFLQRTEILQHADPSSFDALMEILKDTVMAWQEQKVPFWGLLTGDHPGLPQLGVRT